MHRAALLIAALFILPATSQGALPPGFSDELLHTENFTLGLDILPDGRVLAALRPGHLLVLTTNGTTAVVDTIPGVTTDVENGFLGVAAHPDWPDTPYLYYHYTRLAPVGIIIERRTVSGDLSDGTSTNLSVGDPHIVLEVPNSDGSHNGGALRFGPEEMLYVSIGDDEVLCNAQNPELLQGVILRLDVSGLPPGPGGPPARSSLVASGNPFIGAGTDKELVFAHGLRNPFRFHVDPDTGLLYIADVGNEAFEEINESAGGENFGWPWREGFGQLFDTFCGGETPGLTPPVVEIPHNAGANALGGALMYRAPGGIYDFPPLYDGMVFYTEFYSGVWRVLQKINGIWQHLPAVPGQPTPDDWATGIFFALDMKVGPDGAIYYVKWNGQMRRIKYLGGFVDVRDDTRLPVALRAVPNPTRVGNGSVQFTLAPDLALSDSYEISIFNIQGRLIRDISVSEGDPSPQWNLKSNSGSVVAPGTYYYRIRNNADVAGKITILP